MAKTMEHLSDFVFIYLANMTLARRDAYLAHVKDGIKQDTLAALRQAPLHLTTFLPDLLLKKAEEDISQFENKVGQLTSPPPSRTVHPHRNLQSLDKSKDQRSGKQALKKYQFIQPQGEGQDLTPIFVSGQGPVFLYK